MKNVQIKRKGGAILGTFRRLSVTNKDLEAHCAQYGPGVYVASWQITRNQGDGKPRKVERIDKDVFVYADDMPGGAVAPQVVAERAGLSVYMPQNPQRLDEVSRAFKESMQEMTQTMVQLLKPIADRVASLEEIAEEEEEEEEEEDQEPDPLAKFIELARRPKYAAVGLALMSPGQDETKFAQLDQIFQQNPGLMQELIFDVLQIIMDSVRGES